jgi:hypothetical protein
MMRGYAYTRESLAERLSFGFWTFWYCNLAAVLVTFFFALGVWALGRASLEVYVIAVVAAVLVGPGLNDVFQR